MSLYFSIVNHMGPFRRSISICIHIKVITDAEKQSNTRYWTFLVTSTKHVLWCMHALWLSGDSSLHYLFLSQLWGQQHFISSILLHFVMLISCSYQDKSAITIYCSALTVFFCLFQHLFSFRMPGGSRLATTTH